MRNANSQRGFTLLELMVVVGILGMIAIALFAALRLGEEQAQTANLRMTIQDSAREGLYKMIQEIRQSAPTQINIAPGGDAVTFQIPNPTMPVDGNYNVDWANALSVTYAIGGNGTQIVRTSVNPATGGVTNSIVANDVVDVDFVGDAAQPSMVTVSMSVQRNMINSRPVPTTPLVITGQAEIRNT